MNRTRPDRPAWADPYTVDFKPDPMSVLPYAFRFDDQDLADAANECYTWAHITDSGELIVTVGNIEARFQVHQVYSVGMNDAPLGYAVRTWPAVERAEWTSAFQKGAPWTDHIPRNGWMDVPGAVVDEVGLTTPQNSPEVTLLNDAMATITGDRLDSYGKAEDSFTLIADLWTSYLDAKTDSPDMVTAHDVAMMMILMKVARQSCSPKRDNLLDIAGYSALAQRITEKVTKP